MTSKHVSLAALSMLIAGAALAPAATAMTDYRSKYRPLVVFAPSPFKVDVVRQRTIIETRRPAFQDRKVVVVYVLGDHVSTELGPKPGESADALRARFGVAPNTFRVFLVGLDGGVKKSSASYIDASTLFSTIDAMPMRGEEMRTR